MALAAQRLGLRLTDEFVDVGYPRMSMDRPGLRRLFDYPASYQVGYCIVAWTDRFSTRSEGRRRCRRGVECRAGFAIVAAANHIGDPPS